MKRVMVKYKVKSDKADENIGFIKNVFRELNAVNPNGLKYASFTLPDGVSFVHIASIETEDGSNPLSVSEAFAEFQKEIKDRCVELPQVSDLTEVGNYRLF